MMNILLVGVCLAVPAVALAAVAIGQESITIGLADAVSTGMPAGLVLLALYLRRELRAIRCGQCPTGPAGPCPLTAEGLPPKTPAAPRGGVAGRGAGFILPALLLAVSLSASGCGTVQFSPDCTIRTARACVDCGLGIATCFKSSPELPEPDPTH